MIRYTIAWNKNGIACKRKTSDGTISYLVEEKEFIDMCVSFTSKDFSIKIVDADVYLTGKDEAILLKDYENIKDVEYLRILRRKIEETAAKKGFVDVSKKRDLSHHINREKSNKIAEKAVTFVLIAALIGIGVEVSIKISSTAQALPDPKAVEETVDSTLKKRKNIQIPEDIVTVEPEKEIMVEDKGIEPIENVTEENKEEDITPEPAQPEEQKTVSLYNMPTEPEIDGVTTGYLEFDDLSQEEKAITCRNLYYPIFEECARLYGLDPEMLFMIATEERGVHSSEKDDLGAIGLMQIQYDVWINKDVTYYKYNDETGEYEPGVLHITDEVLKDVKSNIDAGAAILQNYLIYTNYNIPQDIQSYNQGNGAVDNIVKAYCAATGKNFKDVRNDPTDLGWVDYCYLEKGNEDYLQCVLRWTPVHTFTVTNVKTKEPVSYRFVNERTLTKNM